MLKKITLLMITVTFFTVYAWGSSPYSIKIMTPEVQQALSARKDRFADLRALKSSGAIGENNHGYVEVLKNEGQAQSIVAQENSDRGVIYKTIAQQNGLEGALSTIESAFVQVQSEKAESGDKIQTQDGCWVTK